MLELKQGSVEAFRFGSWGSVALREGRIAGFRIPSERTLRVGRYASLVVLLLSLACFAAGSVHPRLLQALWVVQAAHLFVKVAVLWKPVRMDVSRPFETSKPRVSLQVEHNGYLVSVGFLSLLSLKASPGHDWIWIALMLVSSAALVYSGWVRGRFGPDPR